MFRRLFPFAPFTKLFHYSIIVSCQPMVYGVTKHRGMEQLVARRAHNPKVRGSSPLPATNVNLPGVSSLATAVSEIRIRLELLPGSGSSFCVARKSAANMSSRLMEAWLIGLRLRFDFSGVRAKNSCLGLKALAVLWYNRSGLFLRREDELRFFLFLHGRRSAPCGGGRSWALC